MTAGSITQNSLLKYWDPAEQYKEILLSSQTKKLIESYENDMKFQNSSGIYDKRISNDGNTEVKGMLLFTKSQLIGIIYFEMGSKDQSSRLASLLQK